MEKSQRVIALIQQNKQRATLQQEINWSELDDLAMFLFDFSSLFLLTHIQKPTCFINIY